MPSFQLTPDAQTDLIDIRRYTVEQWGQSQSNKYLSELRQTIQLLSDTPSIGKRRPDIGERVFSFPHTGHVIYYIHDADHIVVFGVLHKRMVPITHLADRELI